MSQDLETMFTQLVDQSWKRYSEIEHNQRIDDILVGGVIVALVEDGYALIDLSSDGVAHYLRFEELGSKQRLIFRLQNASENLVTARVLGNYGRITIGYGEHVQDFSKLWSTLKSEIKSSFLVSDEPGIITTDADMQAGYIYAQVQLLLDLTPYFINEYEINYALLRQHIHATVHSLKKYLQGRIDQ
jgi:hypothetical protein